MYPEAAESYLDRFYEYCYIGICKGRTGEEKEWSTDEAENEGNVSVSSKFKLNQIAYKANLTIFLFTNIGFGR